MRRLPTALLLLGLIGSSGPAPAAPATTPAAGPVEVIAFGSCSDTDRPQPLWPAILGVAPDAWIWTGDIVYADTDDMARMRALYDEQRQHAGYAELRRSTRVLGIYDDHDYGLNNGGREFPQRIGSQRALLDFLDEPADSPRRRREGAYAVTDLGEPGRLVRIILLDTRYHRDPPGPEGDILGDAQWAWLERQLSDSPAQIHLLVSSIQVIPEEHEYEKWANFPRARKRLLDLLQRTSPSGLVLLSGDRHLAEISRLPLDSAPPIVEVTSSGMTHSYRDFQGEPNRWRVGTVYHSLNFGTLAIDWRTEPVAVGLQIRDVAGAVVRAERLSVPTR